MMVGSPISYDAAILLDFPRFGGAALRLNVDVPGLGALDLSRWLDPARARLELQPESEWEPVRCWRLAFAAMGLKPTRYRCASESLLRRLRIQGDLPTVNPLIDLCNAVSASTALPVAAFDLAFVSGRLTVRNAVGNESYKAFSGDRETPEPGEVIFADDDGEAHARRWTHRQGAHSAVSTTTRDVLLVCEGHHATASEDAVDALREIGAIVDQFAGAGSSGSELWALP